MYSKLQRNQSLKTVYEIGTTRELRTTTPVNICLSNTWTWTWGIRPPQNEGQFHGPFGVSNSQVSLHSKLFLFQPRVLA